MQSERSAGLALVLSAVEGISAPRLFHSRSLETRMAGPLFERGWRRRRFLMSAGTRRMHAKRRPVRTTQRICHETSSADLAAQRSAAFRKKKCHRDVSVLKSLNTADGSRTRMSVEAVSSVQST